MKYPFEQLDPIAFENLVALICTKILGIGTSVFCIGKDGGRDASFEGTANFFPSEVEPWIGKIVIQAKHTTLLNASCSDNAFSSIIKNNIIPSVQKLRNKKEVDYYLLFTNRKLSGISAPKIEAKIKDETGVINRLIGLETIELYLKQFPSLIKEANLNKLLLPLDFDESDIKEIVNSFDKVFVKKNNSLTDIPKRDIKNKNKINKLTEDYFQGAVIKNLVYFNQIERFLQDPINDEYLNKYENTIEDINTQIILHRADFDTFDRVIEYIYKYVMLNNNELKSKRRLVRLFLQYMYYICDIGKIKE